MNKMKRSLFILCFLAFFCPFLATAMPLSEFTADVIGSTMIEGDPPPVFLITVEFVPGQPLEVKVNGFTEVKDVDLPNLAVGTTIKFHVCSTADGLIALEVEPRPSIEQSYELKGYAEIVGDRSIALIDGTLISVPGGVEIKDDSGNPVDNIEDLGGHWVKVEGNVVDDVFVVAEVTVMGPFACAPGATAIFVEYAPLRTLAGAEQQRLHVRTR